MDGQKERDSLYMDGHKERDSLHMNGHKERDSLFTDGHKEREVYMDGHKERHSLYMCQASGVSSAVPNVTPAWFKLDSKKMISGLTMY